VSVLEDEEEVRRKERKEEDMRNVSGKSRRENEKNKKKKHSVCRNHIFSPKTVPFFRHLENCDIAGQNTHQ